MFVHTALSLGLLLISNAVISQSSTVLTVSPGGLNEPTQIADACPTFSWGSIPGASGYELAVFHILDDNGSRYHEQAPQDAPVLEARE